MTRTPPARLILAVLLIPGPAAVSSTVTDAGASTGASTASAAARPPRTSGSCSLAASALQLRPDGMLAVNVSHAHRKGLHFAPHARGRGLLVTAVQSSIPAAVAGLGPGWRLVSAGGTKLPDGAAAVGALRAALLGAAASPTPEVELLALPPAAIAGRARATPSVERQRQSATSSRRLTKRFHVAPRGTRARMAWRGWQPGG